MLRQKHYTCWNSCSLFSTLLPHSNGELTMRIQHGEEVSCWGITGSSYNQSSALMIHLSGLLVIAIVCHNVSIMQCITSIVGWGNVPASLDLTPLEGALGSPVPMALLATTLNSYSTHGLSSTAMADSMSPVTGSGSAHKSVTCVFNQDKHHITVPVLQ